jgi:hypothetical protein
MVSKPPETASEALYRPCLNCGQVLEVARNQRWGARCWKCQHIRDFDFPRKRGERTDGKSNPTWLRRQVVPAEHAKPDGYSLAVPAVEARMT